MTELFCVVIRATSKGKQGGSHPEFLTQATDYTDALNQAFEYFLKRGYVVCEVLRCTDMPNDELDAINKKLGVDNG